MKYINLVLLIAIAFCSCGSNMSLNDMSTSDTKDVLSDTLKYSFLALGDSYTTGTSISYENNYPSQLIDSLASREYIAVDKDLLATNGWTTTDLLNALETAPFKSKKYELVTLLIGVNNQYQNKPFTLFETEFKALLDIAIDYADSDSEKVVVLSIPDYSVTPFVSVENKSTVSEGIQKYNQRKKEICQSYGVTFIDITPISQTAANDNSLLASDNLHPSSKMYSLWISKMIDKVVMKL